MNDNWDCPLVSIWAKPQTKAIFDFYPKRERTSKATKEWMEMSLNSPSSVMPALWHHQALPVVSPGYLVSKPLLSPACTFPCWLFLLLPGSQTWLQCQSLSSCLRPVESETWSAGVAIMSFSQTLWLMTSKMSSLTISSPVLFLQFS